jgi:hypothetical protein
MEREHEGGGNRAFIYFCKEEVDRDWRRKEGLGRMGRVEKRGKDGWVEKSGEGEVKGKERAAGGEGARGRNMREIRKERGRELKYGWN